MDSLRGMMMICCTGTAVQVTNTEVFFDETNEALEAIIRSTEELNRLQTIANGFKNFDEVF